MPYKDPEKQRDYKREWQRANRRGTLGNPEEPGGTLVEISGRVQTPDHVLAVLEEQIDALRRDRRLRTVERAKAIAQLATLCLKVIEAREVEAKVRDVESVIKTRDPANQFLSGRAA